MSFQLKFEAQLRDGAQVLATRLKDVVIPTLTMWADKIPVSRSWEARMDVVEYARLAHAALQQIANGEAYPTPDRALLELKRLDDGAMALGWPNQDLLAQDETALNKFLVAHAQEFASHKQRANEQVELEKTFNPKPHAIPVHNDQFKGDIQPLIEQLDHIADAMPLWS